MKPAERLVRGWIAWRSEPAAIALAAFAVAFAAVHVVPSSPFVEYVGLWSMIPAPSAEIAAWFGAAVAISAIGAVLAGRQPPSPVRSTVRAIAAILLFYIVFAGLPTYGGTDAAVLERMRWLDAARWVAIVFGIGAMFRPALAMPLILYVFWLRLESEGLYRLSHDNADFSAVAYLGLLLATSSIVLAVVARLRRPLWSSSSRDPARQGGGEATVSVYLLLLCTAAYVANYFWSGWGKATLDGPPLAWLFENQTHALIPVAHAVGASPIAAVADLPAKAYELSRNSSLVANALTLLVEIGPIVAVTRFGWLAVSCAAFVPFHLAIFVLTGIFFWKWAFVDVALAIVFWRLRNIRIPRLIAAAAVAVVLVSPSVLPTTKLAWYDTRSFNESYLVAIDEGGSELRVPSNYFLSSSLTFAQMRFALGMFGRMLPTRVFGTSRSYAESKAANACELSTQPANVLQVRELWQRFERFVREHHAYVLSHVDETGKIAYDVYPHHIWSNPALYRAFAATDKRRIVEYRFVTDYVCAGYDGTTLERHVLGQDSRTIRVR